MISLKGLYLIDLKYFKKKNWQLKILAILFLSHITFIMIKDHPHQNVYFNFLTGKNIQTKFEMDYWGLANLDTFKYLIKNEYSGKPLIVENFTDRSKIEFAYLMLSDDEKKKIKLGRFSENSTKYFISNINNGLNDNDYRKIGLKIFRKIMVNGNDINRIIIKND